MDYATTLLAAVLLGVGFVLQQYAAEQEPESRFLRLGILTDLLRKPRWLLGISCMIGGYLVAAWSIDHLELTLVEPLLTTYLVWALVLAVPLSRQAVKATEVVGAVILIAGVTLVSASRSITPIGLDFGSFSHWYAAAIIAGVALVAVLIGHRRTGQVRATLTGLAAGLVFGIQDALTRQTLQSLQGTSWTTLFTHWSTYALVGAGIVGIWLMQNAFSAAPLHASLPAIAAGEPLAGIAPGSSCSATGSRSRRACWPSRPAVRRAHRRGHRGGALASVHPAAQDYRGDQAGLGRRRSRDPAEPAPEASAARTTRHRTTRRRTAPPQTVRLVKRSPPSRRPGCAATARWPASFPVPRTATTFAIPRPPTVV